MALRAAEGDEDSNALDRVFNGAVSIRAAVR